MRRILQISAVIFTLPLVLADSALAIRRSHKPWLSRSSSFPAAVGGESMDPRPVAAEDDTTSKAVANNGHRMEKGDKVAQQALQYKGTRYRYGGTTKRGLDCSGLVARVWADLNMKKIPRASSALYNSGQPVHLAELRAGDLVFFKNTYKRGISHVGVYTGNNKFIHASGHHKGVTITRLSDPYYQLHYAGARRLY